MAMKLVERPNPDWPLSRLIEGFYLTPLDTDFMKEAAALRALGREWPMVMQKRLDSGVVEDWNRRLYGPLRE
jgi:MOSC domain-containing protein YiiM